MKKTVYICEDVGNIGDRFEWKTENIWRIIGNKSKRDEEEKTDFLCLFISKIVFLMASWP